MSMTQCYVCPSEKYVEDHHVDFKGGELSPETMPMCKRCHRTLHDLGVKYFDDDKLDRALVVLNKRNEIWGRPAMRREEVPRRIRGRWVIPSEIMESIARREAERAARQKAKRPVRMRLRPSLIPKDQMVLPGFELVVEVGRA